MKTSILQLLEEKPLRMVDETTAATGTGAGSHELQGSDAGQTQRPGGLRSLLISILLMLLTYGVFVALLS